MTTSFLNKACAALSSMLRIVHFDDLHGLGILCNIWQDNSIAFIPAVFPGFAGESSATSIPHGVQSQICSTLQTRAMVRIAGRSWPLPLLARQLCATTPAKDWSPHLRHRLASDKLWVQLGRESNYLQIQKWSKCQDCALMYTQSQPTFIREQP